MKKQTSKAKRGRPPTAKGAYNPHPARQLGRVSDEDWRTLKQAAEASGKTFTQWAVEVLLNAAKSLPADSIPKPE